MRKIFTIALVFATLTGSAQKFALISKDFKKPILFTDSLSIDQAGTGYIAVRASSLDSLYSALVYLTNFLSKDVQRSKTHSFDLMQGSTKINVTTVNLAYGDSYDINLTTTSGGFASTYKLGESKKLNRANNRNIKSFIKYLDKSKSLFKHEYIELTPSNVMVYN